MNKNEYKILEINKQLLEKGYYHLDYYLDCYCSFFLNKEKDNYLLKMILRIKGKDEEKKILVEEKSILYFLSVMYSYYYYVCKNSNELKEEYEALNVLFENHKKEEFYKMKAFWYEYVNGLEFTREEYNYYFDRFYEYYEFCFFEEKELNSLEDIIMIEKMFDRETDLNKDCYRSFFYNFVKFKE